MNFVSDTFVYSNHQDLLEHEELVDHDPNIAKHQLVLKGNKKILLNKERFLRSCDLYFSEFEIPKVTHEQFQQKYELGIESYCFHNQEYNKVVKDIEEQMIIKPGPNQLLIPIGKIILSSLDNLDNDNYFQSNFFSLSRFCLAHMVWILNPRKYKKVKGKKESEEVDLKDKSGVACYELITRCSLCSKQFNTFNPYKMLETMKIKKNKEAKKKNVKNRQSIAITKDEEYSAIQKKMKSLLRSFFCDHFGFTDQKKRPECRQIKRETFETYMDCRDKQIFSVSEVNELDDDSSEDNTKVHQNSFLKHIFPFFEHYDIIVGVFDWEKFIYKETTRLGNRRRSMESRFSKVKHDTYLDITGENEKKKKQTLKKSDFDKQQQERIDEAKHAYEDREFVDNLVSIGYVDHNCDKEDIAMIFSKTKEREKIWKRDRKPEKYFIGYNQKMEKGGVLQENWIIKILGETFFEDLKKSPNKMITLKQEEKNKLQEDVVNRDGFCVNAIHKYRDENTSEPKFCIATEVVGNDGTKTAYKIHKDKQLSVMWMNEQNLLDQSFSQFFNRVKNHNNITGTWDVPVGSSAKLVVKNQKDPFDIKSNENQTTRTPKRTHDAYSIEYEQLDYDTCGICALSSALHSLVDENFGKHLISFKEKYLEAHQNQKYNMKNQEMTMLVHECNQVRGFYKVDLKRFKKQEYTWEQLKNDKEYWYIVVCLLNDTAMSKDHIVVISHGMIFDSRFKYTFPLSKENLDFVCGSYKYGSSFLDFHEQFQIVKKN